MLSNRSLLELVEELHTLGRWTGAPVLETLGAAVLHGRDTAEVEQILAHIRNVWGADQEAERIAQLRQAQQLLAQLYELFGKLRQVDFELGIEQYILLVQSLQSGFGLEDREALRRLCRLIWVSDHEREGLFDHFFDRTITLGPTSFSVEDSNLARSTAEGVNNTANQPSTLTEPREQVDPKTAAEATDSLADSDIVTGTEVTEQPVLTDREIISRHIDADEAAVLTFDFSDSANNYTKYLQRTDYLPVTRRRLKQNWRFLRRMDRSGPKREIDIEATVDRLVRDRFLLEPVRRAERVNRSELLLLIDRQGSMVPFHGLGRRIEETAVASGRLGHIETYYFNEVPPLHRTAFDLPASAKYRPHLLFADQASLEGVEVSDIARRFNPAFTSVLIFSDGGAARGHWDEERLESTARFLYQLTQLGLNQIAWLNPMPRERWSLREEERWIHYQPNTATEIARIVPMFGMDQTGLFEAINVLRGRSGRPVVFHSKIEHGN